jgi:small conductance mechanosensitive channel
MNAQWQSFVGWLPSHLQGLEIVAVAGLRITMILLAAWLAIVAAQRGIRTLRIRIASRLGDKGAVQRAETLGRVFRYLATVVISLLAGTLVLSEIGISVAPILGAAGVAGLAVGFGAQSLVKDYFTGLFLLVEDQIRQGDVVKLGEHAGAVEEVTLRYVRLRDYDGNVHFVPNGSISSVVNMGRDYAQAVVDVGVAYAASIDAAMKLMTEVTAGMRADPIYAPRIFDDLEMAGVDRWADSAVIIRARVKVAPLAQWTIRREFLRRLKLAFDEAGIEIPFPQLTLRRPQPQRQPQRGLRPELGEESAAR